MEGQRENERARNFTLHLDSAQLVAGPAFFAGVGAATHLRPGHGVVPGSNSGNAQSTRDIYCRDSPEPCPVPAWAAGLILADGNGIQMNEENMTMITLRMYAGTLALAMVATTAWAAAGPTDPQIAAIVVTANQVDIDAGKLAEGKAQSAEVKRFAEAMVADHTAVNKAASDLVHKLNVTPEGSATSDSLRKGGEDNVGRIGKLQGGAFDRAYVDHEVAYHEAVIDALDKTLIPNAQNAELKALLVKVRPGFVAHLQHARHLQSSLGQGQ
jgi:putative membrane protein